MTQIQIQSLKFFSRISFKLNWLDENKSVLLTLGNVVTPKVYVEKI